MLNEKFIVLHNWFNNDIVSKFGISLAKVKKYDFEFKIEMINLELIDIYNYGIYQ